ncbi:hypothetical protein [Nocardioides sp. MH1]|uniref:hypothetical protein n=1 Tax=Nocardioides sp. MH1 TaxID=3242490 RepID=UPI00352306E2
MHTTSRFTRLSLAGAGIGATLGLSVLTGCGILNPGPEFAEGDCVKIDPHLTDSELEKATCSNNAGVLEGDEAVYEVKHVIDGKDGSCPMLEGFFPVTFSDEPTDTTYCLVLATGQ